jgi:hypothetical protein
VRRTLLNCDQVFEVLTRGPFPTGEPEDEAVERHLRACHECRQLAEALRPAVALLHESIASDDAMALPEYQGALPWRRPQRRTRLSIARLSHEEGGARRNAPRDLSSRSRSFSPTMMTLRVVAASLLAFAIGALLFAISWAPERDNRGHHDGVFASAASRRDRELGIPTANGLLQLAKLELPTACLPLSQRPISAEHAGEIAAALENGTLANVQCCTQCHRAGVKQPASARLIAVTEQNCQACHRAKG